MKRRSEYTKKIGGQGEQEAVNYLLSQGVALIDRNIRTKFGEIDILGMDDDMLVFIEVKTRCSSKFGFPEIAVDKTKREHMINSALDYMQSHPELGNDWRIDVIAITKYDDQPHEIKWFKSAISR